MTIAEYEIQNQDISRCHGSWKHCSDSIIAILYEIGQWCIDSHLVQRNGILSFKLIRKSKPFSPDHDIVAIDFFSQFGVRQNSTISNHYTSTARYSEIRRILTQT